MAVGRNFSVQKTSIRTSNGYSNDHRSILSLSLLSFLFALSQLCLAQSDLSFITIDEEDGLEQNTITAIVEDHLGFIWFGNQDGLHRYDGSDFIHLQAPEDISDNLINCLVHSDSIIYAGTTNGLNIINLSSNTITVLSEETGLSSNQINSLLVMNDSVWIGTNKGLNVINKNMKIIHKDFSDQKVLDLAIFKGKKNGLLIATDSLVYYLNQLRPTQLVDVKTDLFHINSIVTESANAYAISKEGKIFIIDSELKVLSKDDMEEEPRFIEVVQTENNDAEIWIGTENSGIQRYEPKSLKYISSIESQICKPGTLSYNSINSIFQDSKKRIWVGTGGGGISYSNPNLDFISFLDLSITGDLCKNQSFIWSINSNNSGLLIGTKNEGLLKIPFDDVSENIPITGEIRTIVGYPDKEDDFILGTNKGLYTYNYSTNKVKRITSIDEKIYSIEVWRDSLIAASDNGMYFIDLVKEIEVPLDTAKEPHYALMNLNDSLLLVGRESGLYSYSDLNNDPYHDSKITSRVLNFHLGSVSNTLFIGTSNEGVLMKRQKESIPYPFLKDRLPKIVYGVLEDKFGNVWVSSNKGIFFVGKDGSSTSFTRSVGIASNEFNNNAYFIDRRGIIYFGGIRGVTRINPDSTSVTDLIEGFHLPVVSSVLSNRIKTEKLNYSDTLQVAYKELVQLKVSSNSFLPINNTFFRLIVSGDTIYSDVNGYIDYSVPLKRGFHLALLQSGIKGLSNDFLERSIVIHQSSTLLSYTIQKNNRTILSLLLIFLILIFIGYSRKLRQKQKVIKSKSILLSNKEGEVKEGLSKLREIEKLQASMRATLQGMDLEIQSKSETIEEKENQLKVKEQEIDFKNQELETRNRILKTLPTMMERISRENNTESISRRIVENLVEDFGFHYAAISQANFLQEKITTTEIFYDREVFSSKEGPFTDKNIASWKDESSYDFGDTDIVAQVFSKSIPNDIVTVDGDQIVQGAEYVDKEKCFNNKIFDTGHQNLFRHYIAFTDYPLDDKEPVPLGVLEVGFEKNAYETRDIIETQIHTRLKIFVRHCAQNYLVKYINENVQYFEIRYKQIKRKRPSSFKVLYNQILELVYTNSVLDAIMILRRSPNENYFYPEDSIFINRSEKLIINKSTFITDDENQTHFLTCLLKRETKNNVELNEVPKGSALLVPLLHDNICNSIVVMIRTTENYFKSIYQAIFSRFWDNVIRDAYLLKLSSASSELTKPFNLFSNQEETYWRLIASINKFLYFEYAGVWLWNNDKSDRKLELITASKKLSEIPKYNHENFIDQHYFKEIAQSKNRFSNSEIINLDKRNSSGRTNKDSSAFHHFKSMIVEPIQFGMQGGFVLVFSSIPKYELTNEDELILNFISSKVSTILMFQEYFDIFRDHSIEFDRKYSERLLEEVLDEVRQGAGAAQAILFWQPDDLSNRDVYKVKTSGVIDTNLELETVESQRFGNRQFDKYKTFISDKNIVERVLEKDDSLIIVKDPDDYFKVFPVIRKNQISEPYFFREKLHASASIRLFHRRSVLFINFKKPVSLENKRQEIQVYGFLVSNLLRELELKGVMKELQELNTRVSKEAEEGRISRTYVHNIGSEITNLAQGFSGFKEFAEDEELDVQYENIDDYLKSTDKQLRDIRKQFRVMTTYRSENSIDKGVNSLQDMIEDALSLMKYTLSKNSITVESEFDTTKSNIRCYRNQIVMVFINLISNSIDAIKELGKKNGKIKIRIDQNRKNGYLRTVFSDNGPGIRKKDSSYIWSSTFTTKVEGTGIGLYDVKRIIEEEHKGKVAILDWSEPGAHFEILLPPDHGQNREETQSKN